MSQARAVPVGRAEPHGGGMPLARRRRPEAQEPDRIGALQGADGGELQTSQMDLGRVNIDRNDPRYAHRQERERHLPGADNREHAVRGPQIQCPGLRTLVLLENPKLYRYDITSPTPTRGDPGRHLLPRLGAHLWPSLADRRGGPRPRRRDRIQKAASAAAPSAATASVIASPLRGSCSS
jgi:hypothetical protein